MAGEWKELALSDIGRVVTGKTPPTAKAHYFDGDIPFVTPTDMNGRRIISTTQRYLSKEGKESVKSSFIPAESVMVSCIGSQMGKSALSGKPCVTNQQINSIIVSSEHDPKFIYYNLSSRTNEIRDISSGSAVPILNKSNFERIPILAPSLPEQRAIAYILGTFDDKIELNQRMNETLEAMVGALFKSWFVDFDPVRAKAEGRDINLPSEITNLFPNCFEDSELGEIPAGWLIRNLGDIADVNWGDTNTTKSSYVETGYAAYSASGSDGYLPYYDFDRTGVVVSAIGANAGLSWLAHGKWSCIKNTIRFWSTDKAVSTEYLFQYTYGPNKWPLRGSAQPFISQGDARAIRVLMPDKGIAIDYGKIAKVLYGKIAANNAQTQTLISLRNTLLPDLLSGEIPVQDAERFLER